MGIQRTIRWPSPTEWEWSSILETLRAGGDDPIVRMIDNLPAFPGEIPAPETQEVRISLGGGMVTLRRNGPTRLDCLTWGNADAALMAALNRCVTVIAEHTSGMIEGPVDS